MLDELPRCWRDFMGEELDSAGLNATLERVAEERTAGVQVFLLYVQVAPRYAVVEHAFGYFQLRAFLLHREQQTRKRHVGVRPYDVLEVKRTERDEHHDDYQRPERLHQRYAGGLDCGKLAALAKVAERYERRQQYGQRQCLRHEHEAHVPEELRQYVHRQALTYQLVDVLPEELHHQYELADEERADEEQPELLGYELV